MLICQFGAGMDRAAALLFAIDLSASAHEKQRPMDHSGNSVKKLSRISDLDEQFRELCLYYSALLNGEGMNVRAFRAPDLPVFRQLDAIEKRAAVTNISTFLQVMEDTLNEGSRLRNNRRILWRALNILGLIPQGDIFDKIADSDVVTLYSSQNILMFQSLNFFDYVSMTLEDVYSNTWSQCSRRESWAVEAITKQAIAVFSGQQTGTYDPLIPEHYCEEVGTVEMLKFYIRLRLISPVRAGKDVVAALVINACRPWDGKSCAGALT